MGVSRLNVAIAKIPLVGAIQCQSWLRTRSDGYSGSRNL